MTKPTGNIHKRGFASMTPEKRREIAKMGGRAVRPENRSFAKDKSLAASAGALGGRGVKPEDRSFSRNHELARAAGSKGGKISTSKHVAGE